MTSVTLKSIEFKEIQEEVLIDGLFVNTPVAVVMINEWMEKSLMVENPESKSLTTEFKLKNQSIIAILCNLWPLIDGLKLYYMGYRKFKRSGIKQQMWEFRMVDSKDFDDSSIGRVHGK